MSNVVDMPADQTRDALVRLLHRAGITEFVLVGYDKDSLECVISDLDNGSDILWHLRRTEHKLMRAADGMVCIDDSSPA
jgi:hypothetical protein